MIDLERHEYGTFLLIDLPWTEGRKGIGLGDTSSEALTEF
jgi:hypothetical protein